MGDGRWELGDGSAFRRVNCISAARAALDRPPSRHSRPCRSSHSLHCYSLIVIRRETGSLTSNCYLLNFLSNSMGHNLGRDNARKRVWRRKKAERKLLSHDVTIAIEKTAKNYRKTLRKLA